VEDGRVSSLLGDAWPLPSGERAILVVPDEDALTAVTDGWSAGRSVDTAHWDWTRIAQSTNETFGLLVGTELCALWAAQNRLRSVGGHACYRLEFIEVAPGRRGAGIWGLLVLAIATLRARELGGNGLLLAALPAVAKWYRALGAVDVPRKAWKAERGTVKLMFVGQAFENLVEVGCGEEAR
jgi:hypothetical protein